MNTKKLLALILSALMLSVQLFSCADSSNDESKENSTTPSGISDETAPETEEELTDGLGNPDFGGYSFRILSCLFGGEESANRIMYEELTGNPVNDSLYESKIYIEDRFGVKYEVIHGGNEFDTQTTTKTSINSGDDAFDIVIGHDGLTFSLSKEGLFYNMYDIDQFDFEKPWWPNKTVEALSVGRSLYCASNYLSYLGLHYTRAVMINKDYAGEMNIEIPYDMVREGKWTTDAMLTMVEGNSQDIDGNGKINLKDKVSFVTGGQVHYCLQEAQDIPVYRRDENGIPYLDLDVDRISTYVEKWKGLMESEDYLEDGGSGETYFKNGNCLICLGQIGDAYDIYRTTDMRYGFLPTPKFDEYQENYINCCTDMPWAIPKTIKGEQIDIIGTLCEAISCYNYKNVLPAYYEVAMKSRTADSPDDAEMLQIIADTRTISFSYSYGMSFANILGDLKNNNKEVASYLKSTSKVAEKNLEKLITTYEDMLG